MKMLISFTLFAALAIPAISQAYEPLAATIKVSGAGVYDYVVIGESSKATDGFDNAYDTLAPSGNLNPLYISTWFSHPEWNAIKNEFRGDIRSLAAKQEWILSYSSTLPEGTPLKIELLPGLNILPQSVTLTASAGPEVSATTDLKTGSIIVSAPAKGLVAKIFITATQTSGAEIPAPVTVPVITLVDGNIDGKTGVSAALAVLRMALGLEPVSTQAISHGDMNGDGKLSAVDALAILKKSVGM